jgi:hypothetical protein
MLQRSWQYASKVACVARYRRSLCIVRSAAPASKTTTWRVLRITASHSSRRLSSVSGSGGRTSTLIGCDILVSVSLVTELVISGFPGALGAGRRSVGQSAGRSCGCAGLSLAKLFMGDDESKGFGAQFGQQRSHRAECSWAPRIESNSNALVSWLGTELSAKCCQRQHCGAIQTACRECVHNSAAMHPPPPRIKSKKKKRRMESDGIFAGDSHGNK